MVMMNAGEAEPEPEPLTKQEVQAAELQLQGLDEQRALYVSLQGNIPAMQSNLDIAKNVLEQELAKLDAVHREIVEQSQAAGIENEAAIAKLAKLYESMKPVESAKIASELSDDLLVVIIPRMNDRIAAKMLSEMDSQRAATLTRKMAKRKR